MVGKLLEHLTRESPSGSDRIEESTDGIPFYGLVCMVVVLAAIVAALVVLSMVGESPSRILDDELPDPITIWQQDSGTPESAESSTP